MLWLGLILVIQISILNPAFALDDICPPFTYLNGSNQCAPCSSCKDGAKILVIRACSGHEDTVCGSIYDLASKSPASPKAKKRKDPPTTERTASIGYRPAQRKNKPTSIKDNGDNVFDAVSSTDYDEKVYRSSRIDIVQAAKKANESLRQGNSSKSNDESNHLARYPKGSIPLEAMSGRKFSFNKNGKHIKKDLSMSDSTKQPVESSTSSNATVESILNQTSVAKSRKGAKSKPKKNLVNVNDHTVSIMDTKVVINGKDKSQPFSFVYPHVENHRIYLEMEEDVSENHKKASLPLFAAAKSNKRPSKPSILIKNNFTANKMAVPTSVENNTDLLQFHQLIGGLADVLSNSSHEKTSNESSSVSPIDDNKNGVLPKESVHDDDYLADESDGDDDDDDDEEVDDDDDDDDEEDGDDEDDDYDENDDDEDDDEDVDEDTSPSSNNRILSGSKKVKHLSFGIGSNSHSLSDDDDDEDDDDTKFNEDDDYGFIGVDKSLPKKWHQSETEVNVEPYSNSPDWQLLILVSVVSACLLFFVFVNVYICIYMKKWKHMKSNFEADVEDLSVRINLMQHGGLDIDDQHYIKNYMTQFKSGRTTEKSSKESLREK